MATMLPVLLTPANSFAGAEACRVEFLPKTVQTLLHRNFPGWEAVSEADLREDDRRLWSQAYPNRCPGLVKGITDDSGRESYAIYLLQRRDQRMRQTLVVVAPVGENRYRLHVLVKPQEVAVVSVVRLLPPGEYSDAEGTVRIRTMHAVIVSETIEAGSIIHFWKDGRYHHSAISE
jgi:hypothetical protein